MKKIEAVFFDLDGTLLDTAKDLGGALNSVLECHGKPTIPMSLFRNYVSKGGMALVDLGFNCDPNSNEAKILWIELVDYYHQHLCTHTRYFDGIETLLNDIEKSKRPWGIVTNKPKFLTDPLIKMLEINRRTKCVVSGDTLPEKKPSPKPLLHACKILESNPQQSMYIGDDIRDIQAGNSAGMKTLVAAYGYIQKKDNPDHWGADGLVHHPKEIYDWLTA